MENPKIDPARLPELYEAVSQLHASLQLDEVIDHTLQAAVNLTGAERAFIQLASRYSLYALPKLEQEIKRLVGAPFETLINDIGQNQQPFVILDTQIDPRFTAEPLSALFTSHALMIVPLQASGEVLGVLIVDKATSVDKFTAADLAALAFFANWASLAIHSAQMSSLQREFIANVTHELVMPLNTIKGFTDLVFKEMAGPLTETQKQFLEAVLRNTDRMKNLISDLLEVARIEARHIVLEAKPVDVRECTEQVINHLRPAILEKQLSLTLHLERSLILHADAKRLAQVMIILLDNAIKYTPNEGKIDISSEVKGTSAKLSIKDSGIGISAADQGKLFTMFFRSFIEDVRCHPGDGLSLYIAKNLVELMGGTIGFESEPGKGSAFWFMLPIADSYTS